MQHIVLNQSREHGSPLLDSQHSLAELFSAITQAPTNPREGHYVFLGTRRAGTVIGLDGQPLEHGFMGGREFLHNYAKPVPELREIVMPYMSEGRLGSFELIRWQGGELMMFARPENFLGSYRVCQIREDT